MNCRGIVLVLAVFLVVHAAPAPAAIPEGPRLGISIFSDGPGGEDESWEVITTGPIGEDPQRLIGDRGLSIGNSLSWSGDGSRLAFDVSGLESTASGPFGTGWPVVEVVDANAGAARVYPRAFLNSGDSVISPDGRSAAFRRLKVVKTLPGEDSPLLKGSIFLLDVEDGSVRRLTPWRALFLEPIAYSPDGSALVALRLDGARPEIVAIDLHGNRIRRLARLGGNAFQPTYSPDGSRLAFVRSRHPHSPKVLPIRTLSELFVARADGSGARRLLRRKGHISSPSWDPSGSRLAFIRNPPGNGTGLSEAEPGNKVMSINADGTCLTRVFTHPEVTVGDIAWQPGPGREAGPISC